MNNTEFINTIGPMASEDMKKTGNDITLPKE